MATEKAKETQDRALKLARKNPGKPGGLLETLAGKAINRRWNVEIERARKNIVADYLTVGLLR